MTEDVYIIGVGDRDAIVLEDVLVGDDDRQHFALRFDGSMATLENLTIRGVYATTTGPSTSSEARPR